MATNLLDIMKPEDKAKALARYHERISDKGVENKISSEIYITAEFGYYFGWQGIQAIRNNELSFEEAFALLEGARKVWYNKLCEQGRMTTTAVGATLSKHPKQSYKAGMKPFVEKAIIQ